MAENAKNLEQYTQENILKQRQLQKKQSQQKIKLMLMIGVLLVVLLGVILYASSKQGGIANLVKGNKDPVSNTIANIGSSLTGDGTQSTPVPDSSTKPVDLSKIFVASPAPSSTKLPQPLNYFDLRPNVANYETTIRTGESVLFKNNTGNTLNLTFADGRIVALRDGEEKSSAFLKSGVYSFQDKFDTTELAIHGKISVSDNVN